MLDSEATIKRKLDEIFLIIQPNRRTETRPYLERAVEIAKAWAAETGEPVYIVPTPHIVKLMPDGTTTKTWKLVTNIGGEYEVSGHRDQPAQS